MLKTNRILPSCFGRGGLAFALVLALLVASAPVKAQPAGPEVARPIVDDAVAQYNLGHYPEAAALFERAYQLDPAPILLFNIGQCHRRLGNHDLALSFYRRYLEQAPASAAERPDVEKRVADLERTLREQADLKDKPPPGVGRDVAPGVAPAPGNAGPTTPPVLLPPSPSPVEENDSRRRLRTAAWVVGGVAAGSLVFGAVEAVLWADRASTFNDHRGGTAADPTGSSKNCGADEPDHGGPGCAALYEDVTSARTLSIVGLAAGGLLGVGSAVLFSMSARSEGAAPVLAACAPSLSTAGVMCRLSF